MASPRPCRAEAAITIDAPLAVVWAAMIDVAAYGAWNPFIIRIVRTPDEEGRPIAIGSSLRLIVRWANGEGVESVEVVTRLDPPDSEGACLDYSLRGPLHALYLVRATRTQRLTLLPDGRTRYDTRDDFTGLLTRFLPLAKVQDGFERHARALKAHAEATHRAAG